MRVSGITRDTSEKREERSFRLLLCYFVQDPACTSALFLEEGFGLSLDSHRQTHSRLLDSGPSGPFSFSTFCHCSAFQKNGTLQNRSAPACLLLLLLALRRYNYVPPLLSLHPCAKICVLIDICKTNFNKCNFLDSKSHFLADFLSKISRSDLDSSWSLCRFSE